MIVVFPLALALACFINKIWLYVFNGLLLDKLFVIM